MIQTLAVSLSLKNTYQVNCIMYAIKQTPIINRFLPDDFYGAYKVKLFANVLSILWEIMSTFAVKLLYFGAMLIWAMCFYQTAIIFSYTYFLNGSWFIYKHLHFQAEKR